MNIVILAAGQGKRMHSNLPKVLHPIAGKPLAQHVIDTARQLTPEKLIVVYGHGGEVVRSMLQADDIAWAEQAQQLGTGHAVAQAVSQLGNAAQTIHPIGAQGFNLGLRDALTLAELIEQSDDPGSESVLQAYATRRAEDRRSTLAFSDGLARITGNPASMLRPLRSLGLLAADQSSTLQSMLVGGAMGFRGEVPALCREAVQ